MSTIIENAARAALNILPGVSENADKKEQQKQRGRQQMADFATGGLAIGGGVGLGVALLNYLRSIKEEARAEDPSSLNDDVLYMPAPVKSAGTLEPWLAPGLAVTGGALTAGAGYALVTAIADRIEKRRRQKLLDDAQQETLAAVEQEAMSKRANSNMTVADALTAIPVALPLLAALSAGGISYAALNKAFPTIKRRKQDGPKKIKFVDANGSVVEETDVEKVASEAALIMVDQLAKQAGASHCLATDFLNFVAQHGKAASMLCEDSEDFYRDIEGSPETSMANKSAAAKYALSCPFLSPVAGSILAAEVPELLPATTKSAAHHDVKRMEHIHTIVGLAYLGQVAGLSKSATVLQQEVKDRDSALTSDASGSASETMEETSAVEIGGDNKDPVDSIMGDIKNSPIPPQ